MEKDLDSALLIKLIHKWQGASPLIYGIILWEMQSDYIKFAAIPDFTPKISYKVYFCSSAGERLRTEHHFCPIKSLVTTSPDGKKKTSLFCARR